MLTEHLDACRRSHRGDKPNRTAREYIVTSGLRSELMAQANSLSVDLGGSEPWRRFNESCESYLEVLGEASVPLSSVIGLRPPASAQAVDSREYQCKLRPELFARGGADIEAFLAFLGTVDKEVRVIRDKQRTVTFARRMFDTNDRAFANANMVLRARIFDDHMRCTFKAADTDRYVVAEAPVESSDPKAVIKLEEGIYAFCSRFSRQSTSKQPLNTQFPRVADWARIFPGAVSIAPYEAQLELKSDPAVVTRVRDIELDFGGHRLKAMLEIGKKGGVIKKIEFSFKDRHPEEGFRADTARRIRRYYQALNQSSWIDIDREHRKVERNATSTLDD
jgi:hypothetical protein